MTGETRVGEAVAAGRGGGGRCVATHVGGRLARAARGRRARAAIVSASSVFSKEYVAESDRFVEFEAPTFFEIITF